MKHPLPKRPVNKEPNDEGETLSGRAAARTVASDRGYGSGANAPTIWERGGPRGRCSVLERRLYDRPRPKPMRRAHVGLWQPPSGFTVQESVLTLTAG